MTNKPFQNKTILLVEGETDVIFIQALLEMIDFKDVIITNRDPNTPRPTTQELLHLHESGGTTLLKTFEDIVLDLELPLRTGQAEIKVRQIIALIDGDKAQKPADKLGRYNKVLAKAGFTQLSQANQVQQDEALPISFGVYILKDFIDNQFHDLESLLFSLVKDDALKRCLEEYFNCVCLKNTDKYIHKRKIASLLPVLKDYEGNTNVIIKKHFTSHFKTQDDVEKGHSLKQLIALLENIKDNTPDAPKN